MATDPNPVNHQWRPELKNNSPDSWKWFQAEKGKVAEIVNRLSRYEPTGASGATTHPMHAVVDPQMAHAAHPPTTMPLASGATSSNGQPPHSGANTPARVAVVRFSYAAQQEDELSLNEGDKLEVLEDVEDGWARGHLLNADGGVGGRTGMFPTNFVSFEESNKVSSPVIGPHDGEKPPSQPHTNGVAATTEPLPPPPPTVRVDVISPAVKSSQQQFPRLAKSTILTGGVENSSSSSPSAGVFAKSASAKASELARVVYRYDAANADELSLPEGAIVTILSKNCEDEGWYEGEYQGHKGLFPENFVRMIESSAAITPTAERPPLAMNPPQLPAKPSKPGIQVHERTTSSGGPVASMRSNEPSSKVAANAATLPIVKQVLAQEINSASKLSQLSAQPSSFPGETVERKSVVAGGIANLQSILFRDGKLPSKRPPGSANHANVNNGGMADIRSNSPPTAAEPSISDESDKLTSLTKARPKQTNKRPPSINYFRISAPPQKSDDSPMTRDLMSASVHPQAAVTGLATTKAEPVRLKATPTADPHRPALISQPKLEHVDTHPHVPPARPSPPNLNASPGIALSPERASRVPPLSSNLPPPAALPTPQLNNEWVSRREFEKYKQEVEKQFEEMNQKISKLSRD